MLDSPQAAEVLLTARPDVSQQVMGLVAAGDALRHALREGLCQEVLRAALRACRRHRAKRLAALKASRAVEAHDKAAKRAKIEKGEQVEKARAKGDAAAAARAQAALKEDVASAAEMRISLDAAVAAAAAEEATACEAVLEVRDELSADWGAPGSVAQLAHSVIEPRLAQRELVSHRSLDATSLAVFAGGGARRHLPRGSGAVQWRARGRGGAHGG